MKTNLKNTALKIAITSLLLMGLTPSVIAGVIGGEVAEINDLQQTFVSNITIVAGEAQADTTIMTGIINNNMEAGWNLTVSSANLGKLNRGAGGIGNEINYEYIQLVKQSGILGADLVDPHAQVKDITGGSVNFDTGSGLATSATEDYGFALQISWKEDSSMLAGSYSDTITLTLATDA